MKTNRIVSISIAARSPTDLTRPYLTTFRTSECTASSGSVVFKGRRNSIPWQAANNSIASTEKRKKTSPFVISKTTEQDIWSKISVPATRVWVKFDWDRMGSGEEVCGWPHVGGNARRENWIKPWHPGTAAPRYPGIPAPRYPGTAAPRYPGIPVSQHPYPILPRACGILKTWPFSTFLTTLKAFLAANPPIDTWSSWPAAVDNESTEEGWHRTLFSETEIIRQLDAWEHPWTNQERNFSMSHLKLPLYNELSWSLDRVKKNRKY